MIILMTIVVDRWESSHCELAGWGMQEYNNTESYPDSVRAARIRVSKGPNKTCIQKVSHDVSVNMYRDQF